MTKRLQLGRAGDASVGVDLEVLLETRLLITATSGGGKSGAVFQLCEQAVAEVQTIILDREGEMSPLRAKYPFVLVGPGGDTPASPQTAAKLARTLLELGVSAIIDLYELPRAGQHEFVRDFLMALVEAPKSLWHPALVVIDEAHLFAPEKGETPSVAAEAVEAMATRGRKRGFGLVLATQRLAMLSKTVAAMCQNALIGRTSQIDQERAAKQLHISGKAEKEEFFRTVSRMQTGQFFAYGMAFGEGAAVAFQVTRAETLPEKKDRMALTPPPAPAAIRELLPRLAELPQEAEREAQTVEELREEVRRLQGELARLGGGVDMGLMEEAQAAQAELERLRVERDRNEHVLGEFATFRARAKETLQRIQEQLEHFYKLCDDMDVESVPELIPAKSLNLSESGILPPLAKRTEVEASLREGSWAKAEPPVDGEVVLRGKSKDMLAVCARMHPAGVTEAQVAMQSGMKRSSGTFGAYKSLLVTSGSVAIQDGVWTATKEGMRRAGTSIARAPRNTAEVLALWTPKLRGKSTEMLNVLVAERGKPISRTLLATRADLEESSGTFGAYLSLLRTAGLIVTDSSGVRANKEALFL